MFLHLYLSSDSISPLPWSRSRTYIHSCSDTSADSDCCCLSAGSPGPLCCSHNKQCCHPSSQVALMVMSMLCSFKPAPKFESHKMAWPKTFPEYLISDPTKPLNTSALYKKSSQAQLNSGFIFFTNIIFLHLFLLLTFCIVVLLAWLHIYLFLLR